MNREVTQHRESRRWRWRLRPQFQDKDSGWVLASFMKPLHNITEASPAKSNLWLIRSVLGDIQELKIVSRWQKGFDSW